MSSSSADFIVIGAGLAGAATAWRLAQGGHSVTVLERTTPGNDQGSSHGSARIFRYAYPNRFYTDLVLRARAGWDELERTAGTSLITPTGAVDHGEIRDPQGLARVLESAGVEHELMTAEQAAGRWPQFRFSTEVLWHPAAGVLDAAETIGAMLRAARRTGHAEVLSDWEVAQVSRTGSGGFRVRSSTGEIAEGRKVIVAAGGWLPHLLGDLALAPGFLDAIPPLQVRQEQAFHMPYRETDPGDAAASPWPTFIHKSREIEAYGLPGGRDAGFAGQKLAQYNGGHPIPSALDQDGMIRPEMRERMVAYAERHLPGLVPEPYAETTCLFTNTPTEDFVIDESEGVVVLSACSGHGAKFAPLLGELAAGLATGEASVPEAFRVASHRQAGVL